ncbi:transposase, partial [Kitasatospora sp. NPDC056531]|uniref:IS256 family transposase n=1 Tax=Kitasatospora sp. NPDC056531 TaxID=3345856 RepID=UPI0036CD5579
PYAGNAYGGRHPVQCAVRDDYRTLTYSASAAARRGASAGSATATAAAVAAAVGQAAIGLPSQRPPSGTPRDCCRRGMRDPELVIGDGAMGLWKALAEVFPATRHQRCWVHEARNVTNALPKSAQPGVTKAMQEIYNAEDRAHAEKAVEAFAKTYGAKWPKAVAKIAGDAEELLAFYDFPAEHWIHLRTTNPIESTFSTVKLRTKVTRGAGSPTAALAMVFKLVESAQERWRAITGASLVALVRSGARFENGVLVECEEASAAA